MTDMEYGATGAGPEGSQVDHSKGLHDPDEVQRYAADLERVAGAVARDRQRAQELIDAVHSGKGTNVEKIFRDAGVETKVSIKATDLSVPTEIDGVEVAADTTFTTTKTSTEHFEVSIDIGPIHLSAGFDKESSSTTVTG